MCVCVSVCLCVRSLCLNLKVITEAFEAQWLQSSGANDFQILFFHPVVFVFLVPMTISLILSHAGNSVVFMLFSKKCPHLFLFFHSVVFAF